VRATRRGRAQLGLGGGGGVRVGDDAGVGMTRGSRLLASAGEGGCCAGWRRLAGLAGPAGRRTRKGSGLLRPARLLRGLGCCAGWARR
jgi:hypothetical protein